MHRFADGHRFGNHKHRRTIHCIQVAIDRFPYIMGSWSQLDDWRRSGNRNPIRHDVLIALKRVNVERHIDVDRDVGSAFAVAKKLWAEK
jgi:hypothetical protein